MSNKNNINSRLNKVNKQLLKLNGNNGGLNFKGLKSKLSLSNGPKFGASSNKVFIIIGVILLLIILGVGGYFLYRYFTNKKVFSKSKLLIPYIHDAQIDKLFSNSSIPRSASGNEYNINMWIYVNDYKYRHDTDKCILFKTDSITNKDKLDGIDDISQTKNGNPSIWLKKTENTFVVVTGLDTVLNSNSCGDSDGSNPCPDPNRDNKDYVDKCEIKNFPLQRWVNVNVSLRNNVLDIFMDGTLKKSCILSGSPTANAGDLYVLKGGHDGMTGFNGYISKLEYTNKALSTDQIMKRYTKGPTVKVSKGFLNIFN
jgi:hypothetical protein